MRELRGRGLQFHSGVTLHKGRACVAGMVSTLVITLLSLPGIVAGNEIAKTVATRPASFTIYGTWNTLPAIATLIRQYENDRQAHCVNFTPIDSDQILERLSHHECDVGMPFDSFVPEKGKKLAHEVESYTIARYAVGVAVNTKNSTRIVTMQDLRKIFAAYPNDPRPVTSWREIGDSGNNARIEFYRPPVSSAVAWFFRQRVLQGSVFTDQWLDPSVRQHCEKKTDAEVIGEIIKQTNSIGFFLYHCEARLDKRIRILRIANDKDSQAVPPSASTIADGTYPLVDTLTLYVHPDAPPSAIEFCKFATGREGAKIVKQFGLWPEYGLETERGKQRAADVKAGKGTEIVVCDVTGYEGILKDLSIEFVKAKTAVQLKFQKGETRDTAIEKLAKGATELLLADGPLSAKEPGSGDGAASPKSVELGRMAAGIIVHPENPLESLPLDEAKGIFCGEIEKWPAVRGAAPAIHVFGLKHGDPIVQLLKEKLVEGGRGRSLKYTAQPDTEKVILAVARDPAAIGFVDMGQLSPGEKSVKLVPIIRQTSTKGTLPVVSYPTSNDYPLARTLTLYVSPNASQTAKDFADFLTPEHCKETIAQYNLLPPLHAEETKLARTEPGHEGPQIDLTSADEPPPLLDDPDAPQGQSKPKKLAAKPKPAMPTPEQPVTPKAIADAQPATEPESEPTPAKERPGAPSMTDEQIVWLVGGVVGVVLLALGVGWLRAPKRKRFRR